MFKKSCFLVPITAAVAMVFVLFPTTTRGATTPDATAGGTYRAKIITHNHSIDEFGQAQEIYDARILQGPKSGTTVTIGDNESVSAVGLAIYQPGDIVYVSVIHHIDGTDHYFILDVDRRSSLWWLIAIFVAGVAWFSRWRGIRSLVALAFSIVVIIWWLVPFILDGKNPVTVTLLAAAAILLVSFILDTGLRRATWAAGVGTILTMTLIGFLSRWSIAFTHLTGNNSEESFYLQNIGAGTIDIRGLLLAGILIGTLGILDDMAIAQVSVVGELRRANPRMSRWEIYRAAMRVGHGHLAAIVNTLVLAYAGSALPLMLLFSGGGVSATSIVNNEMIATEIVRSIVGSLGLILALPITTVAAVWFGVTSDHPSEPGESHLQ